MARSHDIEDVLSSIRRLVATEGPPLTPRRTDPVTGKRDTTLPALFLDPADRITDPEDPFQMIRSLAQQERDGRDAETFMAEMDPELSAITNDMPGVTFGDWDDDDPEMSMAPDFRGPVKKADPREDRGGVADRIIAQLRATQESRRRADPYAEPDEMPRDFEGTEVSISGTARQPDEGDAGDSAEIVAWPAATTGPDDASPAEDGPSAVDLDEPVPAPLDQPEIAALGADYSALEQGPTEPAANIMAEEPPAAPTDETPAAIEQDDGTPDDAEMAMSDEAETPVADDGAAPQDDPASEAPLTDAALTDDLDPDDGAEMQAETVPDWAAPDTDMPLQFAALSDAMTETVAETVRDTTSLSADLRADLLADEGLRDLVAEIVREELAGDLGERITRNVRKLVRRELRSMMAAGAFD